MHTSGFIVFEKNRRGEVFQQLPNHGGVRGRPHQRGCYRGDKLRKLPEN
jgi:hypothetical protein